MTPPFLPIGIHCADKKQDSTEKVLVKAKKLKVNFHHRIHIGKNMVQNYEKITKKEAKCFICADI